MIPLDEKAVINTCIHRLKLKKTSSEKAWRIFFEGVPLRLRSGKSSWRKKNHASAASTNDLYYVFGKHTNGWEPSEVTKLLQEEGIIEIKQG